jgi:hypothetical protein
MVKEKDQENRFLICFLVRGKGRNKWMIKWLLSIAGGCSSRFLTNKKQRPDEEVSG